MALLTEQPIKYLTFATIGLLVRILTTVTFKDTFKHRVEVITPSSDWKRSREAIHLWNSGLDPYSGNLFHEYPISLEFYKLISNYFNVDLAFCITDIVTALLLHQSIYQQLLFDNETHSTSKQRSTLAFLLYLFSPFTVISCAGQSTTLFTNFLISVILFTLPIRNFRALTCVLSALLACNNIHFSTLILPIFICMEYSHWKRNLHSTETSQRGSSPVSKQGSPQLANSKSSSKREAYYSGGEFFSSLTSSAIICLVSIGTLLVTSYFLMGNSWSFLRASYLFVLQIGDLTPNIGIYWYFFMEMFEHFSSFFTWIVQIIAFIQVIPLCIAFRDQPFFALYMIAFISSICQPYPSLASIGFVMSILPQYLDLFQYLSHGLKGACTFITCMCLWPIFWHLWIIMGTANANFYFGATLAFMAALIFFAVDLLNAKAYKSNKIKFEQWDANLKKQSRGNVGFSDTSHPS